MMNTRYFYIGLAIWILTVVVPVGFAEILPEAYQDRQAGTNMDETVMLATAISRGLYERCLATQYSTNPINYRVAPLTFAVTNKIGWHFDQSMRINLDNKAKSLVSYYCDTNAVYTNAINFVMLTVTGLWAQLEIGDRTNQFTGTPAIGTNPPTYGNYPWRIYEEDLEERYKVLNALKSLPAIKHFCAVTNFSPGINVTVSFQGNMDHYGASSYPVGLYYSMPDVYLGPVGGTYEVVLHDSSSEVQGSTNWYITLDNQGDIGRIIFDSGPGSVTANHFEASLTLSSSAAYIKSLGCMVIDYSIGVANISALNTQYGVNVSADLNETQAGGPIVWFIFYPVINFSFQYCK